MQKLFSLLAVMCFVGIFAVSCKSAASGAPNEKDEPISKSEQEDIDEAFQTVYDQYRAGLILEGATTYTVVQKDTLTKIAKKVWGANYDPYYFPVFILASEEKISDPDLIEPGMTLIIPDLKRNLDDTAARANIKSFLKEVAGVYGNTRKRHSAEMVRHLTELSDIL